MANATNYMEDFLIEKIFRGSATAFPANFYVALFKADPGETGSLAQEVSGGNYARVIYANNGTNWAASVDAGNAKRTSNQVSIVFNNPNADWGTITHWGFMDSATLGAGNMWIYGQLGASRTVYSGDNPPSFAVAALTIDFA